MASFEKNRRTRFEKRDKVVSIFLLAQLAHSLLTWLTWFNWLTLGSLLARS